MASGTEPAGPGRLQFKGVSGPPGRETGGKRPFPGLLVPTPGVESAMPYNAAGQFQFFSKNSLAIQAGNSPPKILFWTVGAGVFRALMMRNE